MISLYYHHDFQKESADWRLAKLESKAVFHLKCQTFSLKYIHPLHQTLPKSEYMSVCSTFFPSCLCATVLSLSQRGKTEKHQLGLMHHLRRRTLPRVTLSPQLEKKVELSDQMLAGEGTNIYRGLIA